ncbi:MAG: hypothetical protein U1C46_10200 [Bacteroidales bacterium]|nr:hypothetical protein [Bacteroidales bacterium]
MHANIPDGVKFSAAVVLGGTAERLGGDKPASHRGQCRAGWFAQVGLKQRRPIE